MANLDELLRGLPAAANDRGRAFERICQWYLRNDPTYVQKLRNVWLWDEWPGRFGPDAGIDLVAETHDGDPWAIQAKAYDQRYSVTKADVPSVSSSCRSSRVRDRLGAPGRRCPPRSVPRCGRPSTGWSHP
jgi:predicted helicase